MKHFFEFHVFVYHMINSLEKNEFATFLSSILTLGLSYFLQSWPAPDTPQHNIIAVVDFSPSSSIHMDQCGWRRKKFQGLPAPGGEASMTSQ